MKIEFNTTAIAKPDVSQPVAKQESVPVASDAAAFPSVNSLDSTLSAVPAVRPEMVDLARGLLGSPQYPPNDILDRIAVLLAMNHK